MRAVEISTLPRATAPPDRPVPAPRGRNGTPRAAQALTAARTSSVVSGKTSASGWPRSKRWASHS